MNPIAGVLFTVVFFGMMAFFFFPGLMIFLFVRAFIGFGVIIPV